MINYVNSKLIDELLEEHDFTDDRVWELALDSVRSACADDIIRIQCDYFHDLDDAYDFLKDIGVTTINGNVRFFACDLIAEMAAEIIRFTNTAKKFNVKVETFKWNL